MKGDGIFIARNILRYEAPFIGAVITARDKRYRREHTAYRRKSIRTSIVPEISSSKTRSLAVMGQGFLWIYEFYTASRDYGSPSLCDTIGRGVRRDSSRTDARVIADPRGAFR